MLWLHLRNSPIRWVVPAFIALDLAVLFLRNRYWIGVWPETGAAAQVPAYFLGAVGAGAAAWVAGAPTRYRMREQLATARIHPAAAEAYRLGTTVVLLLTPYLVGHAVAFAITARTFPPGLHLWLGYLALGLFAMLLATSGGWVLGRLLSPVFAALTAVLGWLVLVVVLGDFAGLTLVVVRAPPHLAIDPAAMALRLGAAAALLMSLPWLSAIGQLRSRARTALAPTAVVFGVAGVLAVTTVVEEREVPGGRVTCVDGQVVLCAWPEHEKYVPLLQDLSARIDALPEVFDTPARMNEFGIEKTTFVDSQGVIHSNDSGHPPEFSIVEGSPWSLTGQVGIAIMSATWQGCAWDTITASDQSRLQALDAWMEAYLVGGGVPDYSTNAPVAMQEAWAAGRTVANEWPRDDQFTWAEQMVMDIGERFCQPRG